LGLVVGLDSHFVLTDNGITLDALSYTGSNAVIHYLNHDFFYVKQALYHSRNIDYCICHSRFFNDCIASADYDSFEGKLIFLPYGVRLLDDFNKVKNKNEKLKLVFLGRLDKSKGVLSLIEIENILKIKHVDVDWLIIGDGPLREQLLIQWEGKDNISFLQPITTNEVYNLLQKQDILIFPSLFEGTPVAIFEALACGCVPIVYDIPGGVREYLNEIFSFKVKSKDIYSISEVIENLHKNRVHLFNMQKLAVDFSKTNLDQFKLNKKYFEFIFNATSNRNYSRLVPKFSFLDKKYVPNIVSRNMKFVNEMMKTHFKLFFS
jgi:glycosyltransferase involved in cell wall biosynthesis